MKKLLCLCAACLSALVTVLAIRYNYYAKTTLNYDNELSKEENATKVLTEDDLPESIITYSDTGGLRVQIPGELNRLSP